jgi:predicted metal-dependent phosphoesterase TrpH
MHYDFHSHTHYSDGVLSPEQLVMRAEEMGLDLLAISDHDSISGIEQARDYVKANNLKLKLVDAIELSAQSDFGEIHIVGLNIDISSTYLLSLIAEQQDKRWQRARAFEEKFQKINIDGVLSELEISCKQVVTRSHIARALVTLGLVKDNNQAFKKYIGKKGRVKVASDWIPMEQAISAIQTAGGLAILAHPTRYPMSVRKLEYLIEEFKIANGDAIEMAYPSLTPDKRGWLEVQRNKNNLLASGGSDFHYPNLKWSDLGRFPSLDKNIPHVLDRIKNRLQ